MEVGLAPLMVRNGAKWSPALFEPPADSRHDWQILLELTALLTEGSTAKRLLRRGVVGIAAGLGFDQALDVLLRTGPYGRLAPIMDRRQSPLQKITKILAGGRHNLSIKALRAAPHGIDLGPLQSILPRKLATKNKTIALVPEIYRNDMERALNVLRAGPPREFTVIGRRHVRSNNSWMHNSHRLVKGKTRCTVMLHPDDAAHLDLHEAEMVRVSSRVGSIELPVEITDSVMPGVVSIPHGFGHGRQGIRMATAQKSAGVSLNDITDEQFIDALTGMPVMNGVPVRIEAVERLVEVVA